MTIVVVRQSRVTCKGHHQYELWRSVFSLDKTVI